MKDDVLPPGVPLLTERCRTCTAAGCSLGRLGPDVRVAQHCYSRGERIDGNGAGFSVRIVSAGLAAASVVIRDGRRQLVCLHGPGDAICPLGPVDADCWAEALTATEICEVTLDTSCGSLLQDPALARHFFELAHARLERLSAHAILLGRMDGTERLCAFLLDMAARIGLRRGAGAILTLPLSREDIADYLGLNAETVSRIITRLKRSGLVRFPTPTECEIPDLARLETRAPIRMLPPQMAAPVAEQMETRP